MKWACEQGLSSYQIIIKALGQGEPHLPLANPQISRVRKERVIGMGRRHSDAEMRGKQVGMSKEARGAWEVGGIDGAF